MAVQEHTATANGIPTAVVFLAPEVMTAESVAALLPLHGRIHFNGAMSQDFKFRVQLDDQLTDFTLSKQDCCAQEDGSSYCDYQFVLNTFAFSSGEHRLSLCLPDAPSQPLTHTLTISNTNKLGEQTTQAVHEYAGAQWIWRQGDIDSSHFPLNDNSLRPWFDRDDALLSLPEKASAGGLDPAETAALQDFVRKGFCILPAAADDTLITRLNADLDKMLDTGEIDLQEDGDHRVEQIHRKSAAAYEIWTMPAVMKFLRSVFQQDVLPCQTLVFLRGSGQDVHQDTIHLTAFPAGYMCGVWIALEDINEESGPLFVYPGSHRLPRLYTQTVGMKKVHNGDWSEFAETFLPRLHTELELAGCKKETYLPRRGDILIWHENLAHGGSHRLTPGLSRRSIVSHYFSQGAAVWYDSTGRSSGLLEAPGAKTTPLSSAIKLGRGILRGDIPLSALPALIRSPGVTARLRKFMNR